MDVQDIISMQINNCKAAMSLLKERYRDLSGDHPERDVIEIVHDDIDKLLTELTDVVHRMHNGEI